MRGLAKAWKLDPVTDSGGVVPCVLWLGLEVDKQQAKRPARQPICLCCLLQLGIATFRKLQPSDERLHDNSEPYFLFQSR
jgi:hypothetical protein